MKTAIVLVALVALCAFGTDAYRDYRDEVHRIYANDPVYQTHCTNSDEALAVADEQETAYILKKYEVPPSKHEEFLKIADKAKQKAKDMDSLQHCCLSKTKTDNLYYISVTVFDSWKAFCEFLESDEARELKECINKNNIVEIWTPLKLIHKLD